MKATFTDLIGLAAYPMKEEHHTNASHSTCAKYRLAKFVNFGIAVGLDDGLIVPVVRGDKMSLPDFVVASPSSRKLRLVTRGGRNVSSTFSITNLGMFEPSH